MFATSRADDEANMLAIVRNGGFMNILLIHSSNLTPAVCMAAVEQCGMLLSAVPKAMRSTEIVCAALINNASSVAHISNPVSDWDVYRLALHMDMANQDRLICGAKRPPGGFKPVENSAINTVTRDHRNIRLVSQAMRTKPVMREYHLRCPEKFKLTDPADRSEPVCYRVCLADPYLNHVANHIPEERKSARIERFYYMRTYRQKSKQAPEILWTLRDGVEYAIWADATAFRTLRSLRDECFTSQLFEETVRIDTRFSADFSTEVMTAKGCEALVSNTRPGKTFINAFELIPEQLYDGGAVVENCLRYNPYMLASMPPRFATREMYLRAVKARLRPLLLVYVPPSLRDREMCEAAVRNVSVNALFVPARAWTKRLYHFVTTLCHMYLAHLPADVSRAMTESIEPFEPIPQQARSQESLDGLYEDCARRLAAWSPNPVSHIHDENDQEGIARYIAAVREDCADLDYLPSWLVTKEVCAAYYETVLGVGPLNKNHPRHLHLEYMLRRFMRYFPDTYVDLALEFDSMLLRHVPVEQRTYERCALACERSPRALRFVPDHLKDYKLCLQCVRRTHFVFQHVPERLKYELIHRGRVKLHHRFYRFLPSSEKTVDHYTRAFDADPVYLLDIPEQYQTQEMRKKFLEKHRLWVQAIPGTLSPEQWQELLPLVHPDYRTQESCDRQVRIDAGNVAFVPEIYKSNRICDWFMCAYFMFDERRTAVLASVLADGLKYSRAMRAAYRRLQGMALRSFAAGPDDRLTRDQMSLITGATVRELMSEGLQRVFHALDFRSFFKALPLDVVYTHILPHLSVHELLDIIRYQRKCPAHRATAHERATPSVA